MTNINKFIKRFSLFMVIILIFIYSIQFYNIYKYPQQISIFKGNERKINVIFPITANISQTEFDDLALENIEVSNYSRIMKSFNFRALEKGSSKIQFKLFGLIPIRNIEVNVYNRQLLIPGGQSIGVKLNTKGVLVVALSEIEDLNGKKHNPSLDAGLQVGDIIVKANDIEVKNSQHLIDIINHSNGDIKLKVKRKNKNFVTSIKPIKNIQDKYLRIGVWVRDKTAGIGTLTFVDPQSNKFGALGHGITDIDTRQLLPVGKGEIIKAKVSSIEQGKKGEPGEIRGIFFDSDSMIGKIHSNTEFGIYGITMDDFLSEEKAMPVAMQNEIKEGEAFILTTIDGYRIEKYKAEIIKKEHQNNPEPKGMIIKITDNRLIKSTGGIVQGMSGSPIIQDGKLVGAITHVFVNDPTRGYGLYIEWMLEKAGLQPLDEEEFAEVN